MSTAIDRSKFRSTSVAAAKQKDQELDATMGTSRGPSADYHKIKPGFNRHRIYPPHPEDGGELYAVPKGVHWLPQDVAQFDTQNNIIKDDKGKVVTKVQDRPLFNAKIHGGKKKDLVEEYIAFATKVASDTFPDTEKDFESKRKAFLDPVIGGYESKFSGIMLQQSWVMYTDQLNVDGTGKLLGKVLGRLEIRKAVKNALNNIAASESASEPLGTDPFTHVDDGRAIQIIYNDKADKPQDYYNTSIYAPVIAGSGGRITLYPLSDEDLTKFSSYPSLKKQFVDVYDRKAFDNTLKGLKMFDDQHELGVFGYEEFLDLCDQLSSEFPEATEGTTEETQNEGAGTRDRFDKMDRDELKAFIRDEKLGIIVNKTMDDDAVRSLIREAVDIKKPVVEEPKKEESTVAETKVEETPPFVATSTETKEEKTTATSTSKSAVADRLKKLKETEKKS